MTFAGLAIRFSKTVLLATATLLPAFAIAVSNHPIRGGVCPVFNIEPGSS